ncbi:hypothetical protein [Bacillus sp. JJ722]|uniref:hypothetical protein n=1 Tax=Bacillus sp. JJ722 TaxID=3122973 RepID=UPI002FFF880B
MKKRNLRDQINGELEVSGLDSEVIVTANASQDGFNYGYYIHEMDAGGKKLRLSGAEKKFIDKPAESSESEWLRWIEEGIEEELRREGW